MRYTSLSSLEDNFIQKNAQEYQFRKIAVPVKGESLTLEGFLCTPLNRSGYYYPVAHEKKRIVLHFTAGQIRSDLSALTRKDYHVSVAFVIGRNGTIYQLFSSKYWSGHIGKGLGNVSTGNAQDKCTIGIEISNYGFLTEREGNLETYYSRLKDQNGNAGPVDVYCSLADTQAYEKLQTPFRGQSYYATYTEEQYNSLTVLLRYLTAQYDIPREFLPENKRFRTTEDVLSFRGIVSHINYRVDGKWDIGQAFDWNKIIDGVKAPTFASRAPVVRDLQLMPGGEQITSEEEIEQRIPVTRSEISEDEPYEDLQRTLDETGELKVNDSKSEKKKLYALIVGINSYEGDIVLDGRVSFPPLRGCVDDAEKVESYLRQDTSFEPHIALVTDSKATKAEIARLFTEHLGQAREGDVALFYYSGHGTQEFADKSIWKSDTDGKLESIACYYDEQTKDDFLLADKELRYLIQKIAVQKPHVVTIFDCCHSADNTRNGVFAKTAFSGTIEKRIPYVFKKRDWNKFIFSNAITYEQAETEGEWQLLPEGQHVQLSACESDESAVEVAGEGVFTKTVLQVLKTAGGDITYHSLRNRVRQYLRNVYEQKPRIYVAGGEMGLMYTTFLNKSRSASHNAFGDITYNPEIGWQLNLGAIHGIGEKTKSIKVIDPQNIARAYTAKVGLIGTDYSQLIPNNQLDINKVYQGYVEGLLSQNLKVHIKNTNAVPEDQQELISTIHEAAKGYIVAEDQEENADYVVHNKNGKYFITLPNDSFRPLALPLHISDPQAPATVAQHLQHISQWQYLKNFSNQDASNTLPSDALKIELFQVDAGGEPKPIYNQEDVVNLLYENVGGRWKTQLKVRLTNTTTVNLYCCTLYLSSDFAASLSFLNPEVYLLEPGNTVELSFRGNPGIPVYLDEVTRWYNWAEQTEYLKFIVSTEEFDAQSLSLEGLPKPLTPKTKTRGGLRKGLGAEEQTREEDVNGWTTRLVTISMRNPELNLISDPDLRLMLNDPEITDFALGLYFDAFVDEDLQPSYQLKPSIRLMNEDGQLRDKGFLQDKILDTANWWARQRRNNHYREITKRFPNRLRIVSEGDSWFQHPLVLDTIDHLSRTYAIYCVAAAGDTLRNYLSNKNKNGEYFLNAIEEQDPAVFLLSGGGNDILGSQFRSYLIDNPDNSKPEGEDPRRYLKNSLFQELDDLMNIYRSLFGLLKTHHPNLHTIVHGYDYPVKLNNAKKGWLGRYMIEKGINREGDRKAIIRLIMDTFNSRLDIVAKEFVDTVTYLDVRNTVRFNTADGVDQWYDEIHPNNEGFQLVAMRFMQRINELAVHKKARVVLPADGIKEALPKRKTRAGVTRGGIELTSAEAPRFERNVTFDEAPAAPKFLTTEGQLEYDIPGSMHVGQTYTCKVNIADETVAAALLKISPTSEHHDVRIAEEMSVRLIDVSGGKNFKIFEVNSERQAILPNEITSWIFKVSPIEAGRYSLLLKVTVHLQNRNKDLNVLEKEVLVSSNANGAPLNGQVLPKRILFLTANPSDTEMLRLGAEARMIKEELLLSSNRDHILFTVDTAVTPRTMTRSILREKPSIIHFSGHGQEEGLCLEDEDGVTKLIENSSLDLLFSSLSKSVQCVLLNACYSKEQAEVISRHIPYVIGMQHAIEDEAAIAFAVGFYQAIGAGEDFVTAYNIALASMTMEAEDQKEIPVLLQNTKTAIIDIV